MPSNNEQIHEMYQKSSLASKRLAMLAFLLEAAILAISVTMLFLGKFEVDSQLSFWAPFVLMCIAIVAFAIDQFSQNIRSFSQKCRRISVEAHAMGFEATDLVLTDLLAEFPSIGNRLAGNTDLRSLETYYVATQPAGLSRLRELTLHSSFWTWNLLKYSSKFYFAAGCLLLVFALATFYYLAQRTEAVPFGLQLVEVVCTVIVAVVFVKCWKKAFALWSGSVNIKNLESTMIQRSITTPGEILSFVQSYNLAREVGPDPQQLAYWILRSKLNLLWSKRVKQVVHTKIENEQQHD